MADNVLKAHFSALGCFFEEVPTEGCLTWDSSVDLFGDNHRILLEWNQQGWEASRIWISSDTSKEPNTVWFFKVEKTSTGRFKFKSKEGPVIKQMEEEGIAPKSIVEVCKWIKKEIKDFNTQAPAVSKLNSALKL